MTQSNQMDRYAVCDGCHWAFEGEGQRVCSLPDTKPNPDGTCGQFRPAKKAITNDFSGKTHAYYT